MNATVQKPASSRIHWLNVLTVISAAILIGAEVFGAAFAAGWAFGNLAHLPGRLLPLRRRRDGALHPQRSARRAVHRALSAESAARFAVSENFLNARRKNFARVGDSFA